MAEITSEVDNISTINNMVQAAVQQGEENFDDPDEMLYTIEMLEVGLQDVIEEVKELKDGIEGIEKDTASIKQRLSECSPKTTE